MQLAEARLELQKLKKLEKVGNALGNYENNKKLKSYNLKILKKINLILLLRK